MRHPHGLRAAAGAGGVAPSPVPYSGDIAFAQSSTAGKILKVFQFEAGIGYGAELVGLNLGNNATSVAFSPSKDALAVSYGTSLRVYDYTPGVGAGASSGASTGITILCTTFSNSGSNVVAVGSSSPRIKAYPWSSGSLGSAYSNPISALPNDGNSVAFSPSDAAVAVAHDTAPRITIYEWSNLTGFGAKYSDPASALPSNADAVAFNNAGNVVFVSTGNPFIHAYAWSDSTGFGSKFSNPSTLPVSASFRRLAVTPNDNALIMASTTRPQAYRWNNSTGFGAKYSDPSSITSTTKSVAITPNGDTVFFPNGSTGSQDLRAAAYPWDSSTGFGARYTGVNHEGQPNDVAVLPS